MKLLVKYGRDSSLAGLADVIDRIAECRLLGGGFNMDTKLGDNIVAIALFRQIFDKERDRSNISPNCATA